MGNSILESVVDLGLRPLEGKERVLNPDGSYSTERTVTLTFGNQFLVAPSLWMSQKGPIDLRGDEDAILNSVLQYERRTGKRFPRFNDLTESEKYAVQRSLAGGASVEPLAK